VMTNAVRRRLGPSIYDECPNAIVILQHRYSSTSSTSSLGLNVKMHSSVVNVVAFVAAVFKV
jgi:hypothetical protein